jgi:serine/threonine-protein kinase
LLRDTLGRLDLDGPSLASLSQPQPRASLYDGAAGVACALYRASLLTDDARNLALAQVWGLRAATWAGDEAPAEAAGRISPYHVMSGVHAVLALIATAGGDDRTAAGAIEAFVRASREPCVRLDLALGHSGTLVAASLLHDAAASAGLSLGSLRSLAADSLAFVWNRLDELPAIPDCSVESHLGLAHGWAGILYATLRWCASSKSPLPQGLPQRLFELSSLSEPDGRGRRWPRLAGSNHEPEHRAGWCDGTAGFVLLWCLASRVLSDPRLMDLAESAAWSTWEAPDAEPTLCCGLAGRAYALLALYRLNRDDAWLQRARQLAERAAQGAFPDGSLLDSLFRGQLGVALLAADVGHPERSAFPFLEEEGFEGQSPAIAV